MTIAIDPVSSDETDSLKPSTEVGYLDQRVVIQIQKACEEKQNQNEAYAKGLINLASLIVFLVTSIWGNIFSGIFLCAVTAAILNFNYTLLRSRAYLDASEALNEQGFRKFISKSNLDLSVSNIREVHQIYKAHLKSQISLILNAK